MGQTEDVDNLATRDKNFDSKRLASRGTAWSYGMAGLLGLIQGSAAPGTATMVRGAPAALPTTLQSLQCLRALAAGVVVVGHSGNALEARFGVFVFPDLFHASMIGVDLFFCISGFIMYWTSGQGFGRQGKWRSFLARRLLRIYPVYWVVTALTLGVACWQPNLLGERVLSGVQLVASFLLLPQSGPPVVPQAWTLVHEVRFYAFFGLLMMMPWRWAWLVLLAWGLASAGVLVASWAGLTWLDHHLAGRAVNYLCHPCTIQFLLGVTTAYVVRTFTTTRSMDVAALAMGVAGTALVILAFRQLRPDTKYFAVTLFTLPCSLLVLGCALAERRWRPRLPSALVALGDASYSTYLLHNLFAMPTVWLLFPEFTGAALAAVAWAMVAAIHGLSYLFYLAIEYPLHQAVRRGLDGGKFDSRR